METLRLGGIINIVRRKPLVSRTVTVTPVETKNNVAEYFTIAFVVYTHISQAYSIENRSVMRGVWPQNGARVGHQDGVNGNAGPPRPDCPLRGTHGHTATCHAKLVSHVMLFLNLHAPSAKDGKGHRVRVLSH